jgi:hypothetical protein
LEQRIIERSRETTRVRRAEEQKRGKQKEGRRVEEE